MLFTQIEFFILLLFLISMLAIIKNNTLKKLLLLSVSYYFYAYWDYRFLVLILIPTGVDFYIGRLLGKNLAPSMRKSLLFISLIINLGILGFFKYYNFFISSLHSFSVFSKYDLNLLNIILPIGISFYTFRVLSYTIDVYYRKFDPCKKVLDFALYVAFFPVLLAGPIFRASSFLPQLKNPLPLSRDNFYAGFRLFIMGIFLKVFIADRIAMFVNYFFDNHAVFDSVTTWLAVSAYSLQIYCDFAGYSNMAIGIALLLGYRVDENFNFPYLATSISDFWRRWHITLSSWIRDYIYIPLGGNRKGKVRTQINLLFAMLLCGLWHGAAWTFVFWGFYHGVFLVINRLWSNDKSRKTKTPSAFITFRNWFLTFLVVIIGWVFFRSSSFSQAISILGQMFIFKTGIAWYQPFVIFILIAATLFHMLYVFKARICKLPLNAWYTPPILFCMTWLVIVYYPTEFMPFVYFQF